MASSLMKLAGAVRSANNGFKSFPDALGLKGSIGNYVWGRSSAFMTSTCWPAGGLDQLLSQQTRTFVQMRTSLKVVDNSGAKRVMCIQALKKRRGAQLGDTIIASVKEAHSRGKVKKGDVVYCVVVRAAMQRQRCDGSQIKFDDNAVVLVSKQGEPVGTRVFGPVPHELRQHKHVKILTLAEHVV
uniref:Ribosomal protein L14 n=1 Tax=Araucaria cunninghamii TaxID=56994 RepID=A0A0D6R4B8_ARACU